MGDVDYKTAYQEAQAKLDALYELAGSVGDEITLEEALQRVEVDAGEVSSGS